MMEPDLAGTEIRDRFEQLDPASIRASRLQRSASLLVQALAGVAIIIGWRHFGKPDPGLVWLAGAVLAAWLVDRVIFAIWYPGAAWRAARYRLDDRLLIFNEGVFWQSSTAVPLSRVQHTDVTQGPFERRFGIGTLVVHTAGDAASEVTIWGLSIETAYRIRDMLTTRITDSDGV